MFSDTKQNSKILEILLVEDNQGDIDLALEAFELAKYKCNINTCMDGDEAIEYLYKQGKFINTKQPDLVLLDINLPKKNGHEVLEIIKQDDKLRMLPVIMLTTSDAVEDIEKSYSNYTNAYICKPDSIDGLLNVINALEEFWINVAILPSNN